MNSIGKDRRQSKQWPAASDPLEVKQLLAHGIGASLNAGTAMLAPLARRYADCERGMKAPADAGRVA
jgi:hypothetical protein